MHPAITLTTLLFMTLMVGMPLVGWLVSRQYKDRQTQLWYLAIALDSLQIPFVAAQAAYPGWLTLVMPSLFAALFFVAIYLLLLRECNPQQDFWKPLGLFGVAYAALASIVYYGAGRSPLAIYTFGNLSYLVLSMPIAYRALRLGRVARSSGMVLVGLGFLIGTTGFVVRAFWQIVLETSIPVFEFSAASNYLILSQAVNLILITFGYLGYVRDRIEAEKLALIEKSAESTVRQKVAEQHANELQQVIVERDQMVVANSRFLNLSAMAIFNSAIVHEISQPLQALDLSLDNLLAQDADAGGKMQSEIETIIGISHQASGIVNVLRQLMAQGNSRFNDQVDLVAALNNILPVVSGDARQRGIVLEHQIPQVSLIARCNKVLFQRLIINLVANAFDVFEDSKTPRPKLTIQVAQKIFQNHPAAVFIVTDNGPGMSPECLDTLFKPFNTQKPTGMGIGLSLADILLRKWGGRISAQNVIKGTGTQFEILLPLVD